jgi:tetratricopeptide (TPR) repeat protein
VLGLFPHAHYLARTVRVWATLPDGTERWLLKIDDWDPGWQDEYTFAKPITLPKGSSVRMEFSYDNSDANPRNPNHPPKRVQGGEQSVDEMGNVTLQVAPRDPRDMLALREAKYRWQLAVTDDGRTRYNLANVLSEQGRVDDAARAYREAIERDPTLASAYFNLAIILRRKGALDDAIVAYERAATLQPSCGVLTNLGVALGEKGRKSDATAAFEKAIALDARCAPAENSLALSLATGGDASAAIVHFERALTIEPDNASSHFHLGNALKAAGNVSDAVTHYRRALALRPEFPEAAAALAASGG